MALYYIRESGTVIKGGGKDVVVVAPSLYWYAHARFPTKSLSKARKLADAYLDSRPPSYTSIHVEKREEGFDCYAYDAETIEAKLDEIGQTDVPVYFLQQFANEMPMRVDEELTVDTINGVCIEMPDRNRTLPTLQSLDFSGVAKPFNRSGGTGVSGRLIFVLMILLTITAIFDISLRYQKLSAIEKKLEKSRGSRSFYELQSLVEGYEKRAKAQKRLREAIRQALDRRLTSLKCTPAKGCVGD
ncbi:hypothetical protein [Hydrogenimonas sp.]